MLGIRFYTLNFCNAKNLANIAVLGVFFTTMGFHYDRDRPEALGPNPGIGQGRQDGYRFEEAVPKSGRIDLSALSSLDAYEARNLILNSLPFVMRPRLAPHLSSVLHYAEHYALDPFWVLAVMWTESHFQKDVVSSANARGLMQVMPATALHIGRLLNKGMDRKVLLEYAKGSRGNIEFGTYYLFYLLEKFQGDHTLATVAYNMGPYWVLGRLRRGRPVGTKNIYLDKVNRAYGRLTWRYRRWAAGLSGASLAYSRIPEDRL